VGISWLLFAPRHWILSGWWRKLLGTVSPEAGAAAPSVLIYPKQAHSFGTGANKPFEYVPSLDGIRAIAVLLVMAAHLNLVLGGGIGVDIFFVLSGYLITAILLAEFSATGKISLTRFYARRALRLLPALILLLVVFNVYVAIFQNKEQATTARWDSLGALFYMANWLRSFGRNLGALGHLWSLSIEEQFYFLWPAALIFVLKRKLGVGQIMALISLVVLVINVDRLLLYNGLPSFNRIYNGLDTRLDTLLVGCALALSGYRRVPSRVLSLAGVVAAIYLFYIIVFGASIFYGMTFGFTILAFGAALVLAATISNPGGILVKFLRLRPLVWIGRLSYGLYLWHFPVFALAPGWLSTSRPGLTMFTKVFVTFLCATFSYYLVERPCLNFKKRFSVVKE